MLPPVTMMAVAPSLPPQTALGGNAPSHTSAVIGPPAASFSFQQLPLVPSAQTFGCNGGTSPFSFPLLAPPPLDALRRSSSSCPKPKEPLPDPNRIQEQCKKPASLVASAGGRVKPSTKESPPFARPTQQQWSVLDIVVESKDSAVGAAPIRPDFFDFYLSADGPEAGLEEEGDGALAASAVQGLLAASEGCGAAAGGIRRNSALPTLTELANLSLSCGWDQPPPPLMPPTPAERPPQLLAAAPTTYSELGSEDESGVGGDSPFDDTDIVIAELASILMGGDDVSLPYASELAAPPKKCGGGGSSPTCLVGDDCEEGSLDLSRLGSGESDNASMVLAQNDSFEVSLVILSG